VGPDNGLLEWALADPERRVHQIEETRYWRAPVSPTFHGRDVFAPVAAHLAMGVLVEGLGPAVTDPLRLPLITPHQEGAELVGRVMFFDRYGNALTNLTAVALERAFPGVADAGLEVRVAGRSLQGLSRTYGDSPRGTLVALMGSSGRLEIAQVGGDAGARLGLGEGDEVRLAVRAGK
jgi:S-adenosylmethionine hydrolase